jgi:pimeloyl-ACP methyl ester carboxylesterase
MAEHRLAMPDGRALCVLERGVAEGYPILVQGGTFSSRLLFEPHVRLAEREGIRLISYDRPGFGESSPHPGRTVADCAADVRVIADALGLERLGVYGISAGGPHALACAALLPDLVPAVASLASPAPWGAEGLDYFFGMAEANVQDMRLVVENPVQARVKYEEDRLLMLDATPEGFAEVMGPLLSPPDEAVLTGELARFLVDGIRCGLAPGAEGWWEDDVAWLTAWGFELGSIRTPVLLLHGRQDRFVPVGHGEWLAREIPGVETKLSAEDGHLSLGQTQLAGVHEWLLARLH